MKKFLFSILFLSVFSIGINGQVPNTILTLPLIGLKNESINKSLNEVSEYISMKPKGMLFPITKILFTQSETSLKYEIVGVDNSWANLFKYGESSYGYTIVNNRLFVIVGLSNEDLDLNPIFAVIKGSKAFNKANRPPSGVTKNPKWYYELKDGEATRISVLDLDILDR